MWRGLFDAMIPIGRGRKHKMTRKNGINPGSADPKPNALSTLIHTTNALSTTFSVITETRIFPIYHGSTAPHGVHWRYVINSYQAPISYVKH